MSSNEILIQCQAKVSYFLYIIFLNSIFNFSSLEQRFSMQPGSTFSEHQMQKKRSEP
jgi:hypothetical protein